MSAAPPAPPPSARPDKSLSTRTRYECAFRVVIGPSDKGSIRQARQLIAVAALPHVTLTVMPGIAHAANASGFVLADDAAWCEHLAAGGVYTDPQIVSALAARFDSLRAESYRASESAAMIAKAGQLWTAGANPATQMATAASA